MRLFLGIEIGESVASAAAVLVEDLRRRAARLARDAKVTWIPRERMHLTVRFIGGADEAQLRAIVSVLEPPLDVAPFSVEFSGTGTFPRSGPPRVIWAGVSKGGNALQAVEREVTRRLEAVGIPADDRAYSPHLTLARVREAAGLHSGTLLQMHRDAALGTTRVRAITLFESRLSSKGPAYVPLLYTPLARS